MSRKNKPLTFADPAVAEDAPLSDPPGDILVLDSSAIGGEPRPAPAGDRRAHRRGGDGQGHYAPMLAAAATVLWATALAAFAFGYSSHLRPFDYAPFAAAALAVLALAPIGLIWIGAFALQQGAKLLAEARRMQALSDQMLGPAALAAAKTGSVIEGVRLEIDSAVEAAGQARSQLQKLRQDLSEEAQRLLDAVAGSERAGSALVKTLSDEREGFSALTGKLDTQTAEIGEATTRLAAGTADLTAAAGQATDAARTAGDDLARQTVRLEAAGVTVGEQAQGLEQGLGLQRTALVALADAMRADQESLGVRFDGQQAQFIAILRESEERTQQAATAASGAAEILRQLIGEATEQLHEMSDQAQTERDLLGGAALQSLGAFSEAAAFERRALEEQTRRSIAELGEAAEAAHKAAETSSEAARSRVEQLAESAFAVGQQAEASFENRLSEARGLIERSAGLVDEAGARSAARLDQGMASARLALEELQRALAEIESRSASLPAEAEARGLQVKAALDAATEALLGSARTASAELETIDNAFQDRVKRNYEMLSEAARLMGVVGDRAGGLSPRPALALRPRIGEPAAAAEPEARQRLKLTPTPADGDIDPPADRAGADPESADWAQLLSPLDGGEIDDGELERSLHLEIEFLGIDTVDLLPQARIEDIAAALETGDIRGARAIVHRLAPAAVRKLARRVLSNKTLRSQADGFVQQQTARLHEGVRLGQTRAAIAETLGSRTGRAYLIFDAAVGDLS